MSDPVSINTRPANAASRSTLDKLDNKSKAVKSSPSADTKAANAPAPQNADSVNLSNVTQRAKDAPDFDRVKVDAIKQALKDGNYPLNPRLIAESFHAIEQMISE
jgi:negative regulator of flagellin synthesis FlgM